MLQKVPHINFNREALLWAIQLRDVKPSNVADSIGISRTTISRIIRGVSTPSIEVFQMICHYLKLTVEEILEILNLENRGHE